MKKYYRVTAWACSLYGAIDSAFVVFFAVYATFVQFAPWQVAAALGMAAVLVVSMAIDYGLMTGLQTFFGRYYDGRDGTFKRLVMSWSLVFLLIQTFGTLGLTIYGRRYVTDAVTEAPELKKADVTTANQIADVNKGLNDQLVRLKEAERKELKAAVVNPQLTEMAKEGNNWAATEVNKKKKAVTDKYATERLKIEQQIATNLAAQQDATATAGRLAVAEYEAKAAKYQTATATLNTLQLWLSVASTLLLILSSLLYALETVYAEGNADSPDGQVFLGRQHSPFGFWRRPDGTEYRPTPKSPTAHRPVAPRDFPPVSANSTTRAAAPSVTIDRQSPVIELDPTPTATASVVSKTEIPAATPPATPPTAGATPPATPKQSPVKVEWVMPEGGPSLPKIVDVATFGITDCWIPLGSPGMIAFKTANAGGAPTVSMYEIENLRKQLRTYWSELDKSNRGEAVKRSVPTIVKAIERIEAIFRAAGVQTRTRARLVDPKNPAK